MRDLLNAVDSADLRRGGREGEREGELRVSHHVAEGAVVRDPLDAVNGPHLRRGGREGGRAT